MKNNRILSLLTLLIMGLTIFFTGCGTDLSKDPKDLYAEIYGSNEYNISFYSEYLETPLRDMTYTASNMPILPTPSRVGYIFNGWYLDKDYQTAYYDDVLYLYMKDVTLYAKWTNEEFLQYGVYDMEFSSSIVEGSVVKGSMTDHFGGYKDISNAFIVEDCIIENSSEGLQLRLQYDNGVTIPFNESVFPFNMTVDSRMGGEIYIASCVTALSDSMHTQYINLDNFDLSKTMYFKIVYQNYTTDGLTQEEINATKTTYTIELTLTRIIGFSKSYVDPTMELEDGYYQLRTGYKQINNEETMGQQFNPEFSYIYASGGNYTLIKPNYPYAGLTSGVISNDLKSVYYERLAAFSNSIICYPVTRLADKTFDTAIDYYPEYLDAGKYADFTLEYHADKGMFYTLIDLGSSLDKDYAMVMGVTGYMEYVIGMGHVNVVLVPDYEHMVKVSDIEFSPLAGTSFTYQEQFAYYPGSSSDFDGTTTIFDTISNYGLTFDIHNFFYASKNAEGVKSFRISSTPTGQTAGTNVSTQQGQVGIFDRKIEIYDYDAKNESLNADVMSSQIFGSTALRQTKNIRVGKSFEYNQAINLMEIINEKVSKDLILSDITYTGYVMNDYVIDYSTTTRVSSTIYLKEDTAVLIEWTGGYCLLELVIESDPDVTIKNVEGNTYDADTRYSNGQVVKFPILEYSYMGAKGGFYGEYYDNNEVVDPTKVEIFNYEQGLYEYQNATGSNSQSFTISSEEVYAYYELRNLYGEINAKTLLFSSYATAMYDIYDENSNYIAKEVSYIIYNGGYSALNKQTVGREFESLENIFDSKFYIYTKNYYTFPKESLMEMQSITMTSGDQSVTLDNPTSVAFMTAYNDYFSSSSYVTFEVMYYCDSVTLYVKYVKDVTYNGGTSPYLMDESTYIINKNYDVDKPQLISSKGEILTLGSISVAKLDGNALTNSFTCISRGYLKLAEEKYHYELMFLLMGTWQITYNYGEASFIQVIDVKSDVADVVVTYVTTSSYPFNDGQTEKKVTYSLADNIVWLSTGTTSNPTFDTSKIPVNNLGDTRLYAWSTIEGVDYIASSSVKRYMPGVYISDFIGTFNSLEVTMYIVLDYGHEVTVEYSYKDSLGSYTFQGSFTQSAYGGSVYDMGYQFSLYTIEEKLNSEVTNLNDKNGLSVSNNYAFKHFSYTFNGSSVSSSSTIFINKTGKTTMYAVYGKLFTISYNAYGVEDYYKDYISSNTFITNSTSIVEGTTIFTSSNTSSGTITSKFTVIMNSDYKNFIISHYLYYNGSSYVKFDFDTMQITSTLDSYDSNSDNRITLYAVYTEKVEVKYHVSGLDGIYSGYSNSSIQDSTDVRLGSRLGEHMFSSGELTYVAGKMSVYLVEAYSGYGFRGWAYLNKSGEIVMIDLYNDTITADMDINNDGTVELYAVFGFKYTIEFSSGGYTYTINTLYENETLLSQTSKDELDDLMNSQNPEDTNSTVDYWVYENAEGQLVKFDLYTDSVLASLDSDNDGVIKLVAVYN